MCVSTSVLYSTSQHSLPNLQAVVPFLESGLHEKFVEEHRCKESNKEQEAEGKYNFSNIRKGYNHHCKETSYISNCEVVF